MARSESARTSDVAVIGAGAIGLAVSYELTRAGADVVLLEAQESVGAECSFGSAGLVVPSHCIPLARPGLLRRIPGWFGSATRPISVNPRPSIDLFRFAVGVAHSSRPQRMLANLRVLRDLSFVSRDLFEEFAREGLDFEYRRAGVMNVCGTDVGFQELCVDAELLRREGLAPQILDAREACAREPLLKSTIAGAVYWPEDGSCVPDRFVNALAERCREHGVRFELATRVQGFKRSSNDSIEAVETHRGDYKARTVVLAAGAWTAELARLAGTRIPLQAGKGYHVQLRANGQNLRLPLLFQEAVLAATPMGDSLRLAGSMEFTGIDLSRAESKTKRLLTAAGTYLDGLQSLQAHETWCGLRPCTPDSLPIVGRSERLSNLVFATGHGMLGLTLAPVTGQIVSDIIVHREPRESALPIAALSPGRFRA